MRFLRTLSILIFVASIICFGGYRFVIQAGQDRTAPVISVPEDTLTVSVEATDEELLAGITAEDNKDGDVTGNLFIERLDNFSTEGTRKMTVVAYDAAGNVAKASRNIAYSDYQSPHFTLSDGLRFPVGTTDILTNIGATDQLDGDITERVHTTTAHSMSSSAGDYPMEFAVANDAGDVSYLTATVTLYDNTEELSAPQIELTDYLVYVKVGDSLSAWDYLDTITISRTTYTRSGRSMYPDKEITEYSNLPHTISKSEVKIKDGVDYSTPGCYEILYSYSYNDNKGEVRLIVVVE